VVDTNHAVIGYGSVDRTQTTRVESEKIIVNQDYVAGKKADVALIKLKTPVDPKLAIAIADTNIDNTLLQPGKTVTVSGWGATWDNQIFASYMDYISQRKGKSVMKSEDELNFPLKLAEVEIKVIDQDECRKAYDALNFTDWTIGETEICATEPAGGKDSCYGDSGGPLMVPADNPQGQVLVGLVSWGPQCGNPTVPGVYTRVSSFNKWINDQMKGN
jgi:secreted trypsin-like serine protease